MPRLFLSAAHKSSGKTTLTLGLARAFKDTDVTVQPYKKGPDYIDPLWLTQAAGRPCYNLDFNTQTHASILNLAGREPPGGIALIEGNKGLYDGMALDGSDSNAALAALLGAPVVLVIDCSGMTRGIAPLIRGYTAFGPELAFAGIILNKVAGPRHEGKLRAAIEAFTSLPVLGAVPRHPDLVIEERHLGLIPSTERAESEAVIERVARIVAAHVDLPALRLAAAKAAPLTATHRPAPPGPRHRLRMAIARDAAFGFYYNDDLEHLTDLGADLIPLDTLRDPRLPPDIDGLIIGGGFPEALMVDLEANTGLRADIRARLNAGLPCFAECGGLMYLSRSICWKGERRDMVGFIPGEAVMHPRPHGKGLVHLRPGGAAPWRPEADPDGTIRAHEFHHSSIENLEGAEGLSTAFRILRGEGVDGAHDGIVYRNTVASYTHMRGNWVRPFIKFVQSLQTKARTEYGGRKTDSNHLSVQPER